ncbi:fimbria/pilus periplasmic chaperone [Rahnella laticis]|uniref:fimbria/pilus periplasmic chaperone n=1 Tax=Rahnella laticis TaxID=2787622 RepID=UPI0018A28323|nr:fimbria/pilus periplasmic chaperone [Rahnella laticis]MBF7993687.1 fimbria/pilus periplasmic chaperone [Rahnella laticis]
MKLTLIIRATIVGLASLLCAQQCFAAVAVDRTRIIFDGNKESVSLNIKNESSKLPYLAQAWLSDANGNKITSPFVVLPPIQRLDPGASSQVKIQGLPALSTFPQDRESVFYFSLRGIPPASKVANTLQVALETKIKLFYRPKAVMVSTKDMANPWQDKITLSRKGDAYEVTNPTAYYISLVNASSSAKGPKIAGFESTMIAPKSSQMLKGSASALGESPVLTYVNDYGGQPRITFKCAGGNCVVVEDSFKK